MGLLVFFIAVLLAMVSSLRYNENIYDFLPMSGNDQKAVTLYQDISGGQRIIALFKAADGNGEDHSGRLAEAVDTFALKLRSGSGSRHVKDVVTQVDYEKYAGVTDFIYSNMPLMLAESDYARMEELLSRPDYVDEALAEDVQTVMMPATGFFTSSIANDPLSLFSPVMQRLQERQRTMPFEMDNGYIFTSGRRYALAMLTSPYGGMESARNAELVAYVDSVSRATMDAVEGVEVAATGSPVIAVGNASQIKTDSQWAISIAVTLILLLLVFSFRRVKNLLLIGVSIVFGWLFAMGLIAVLRSDVSLIVLGIGSIIIGIAVNYPLHFIAHTDHGGTVREVLKEMVSPLLIGNVTTVGAFASLMPLDAPALRDLGLFAAFMLIGTIVFVLVFLPHLVKSRVPAGGERLSFGRISSMSPDRHRWLMWVIAALTVVFGYFSLGISFDANMHHINYMTLQQTQLLSELHASAGVSDTANVYVVTEGSTWDEALSRRSRLSPLLDSLKSEGAANACSDVTSFIAPAAEQQKKIRRWNSFWERHRDAVLAQLAQKAPLHGFSSDAFDDFRSIVTKAYEPQPFDHFLPLKSVLFDSSFSTSTGQCAVVDVIDAQSKDKRQLEERLNAALGEEGYAFDFVGMNSAVANSLSDDFNYIGFACGCIVFIFLWLSFGRIELSVMAFLPMAFGWIWILGIMHLFGMQFNIVNVILATFIFGQGDDYTIFMTDGLINEYAYRKKLLPSFKNSIVISALIMFIGMGSLIVARHPALHSLAEVTIVGMLTVVLMAWVVPPLVFGWLVRNKSGVRRTPVTLEQVIRITYCAAVYLFQLCYGCVFGYAIKLFPGRREACQAWFHRVIQRSMYTDISHIWGVRCTISNPYGEEFRRGSVMVCNHQSMLDPVYLLALSPKVLVLMGGKVWKNPIVHTFFRLARFINVAQPLDVLKDVVGKAVADGYNVVIFPEGKRTDCRIERFHKGAFYLAQETGADILPAYIHGTGHVMPKGSGFASRGEVYVEVGRRIPAAEVSALGSTHQEMASRFHSEYVRHFAEIRRKVETTHYFHHYIIAKYTYKGIGIEKETRRMLNEHDDFSRLIDGYEPSDPGETVSVVNAGNGQFPLLFALVHPKTEVRSYASDADAVALAAACEPLPPNLHVHYAESEAAAMKAAEGTRVINLAAVLAAK